jgi:hypothetical protein
MLCPWPVSRLHAVQALEKLAPTAHRLKIGELVGKKFHALLVKG